jgi:glutathione-regulated potassium-efflux system protein KefB
MALLADSAIYLAAAVVAVPLTKRAGLGSTVGYLAAGVAIGPSALGFVANPENILHFAEFGVVMLLFLIGLELEPARLWEMRKRVFGTGAAQVVVSAALFTAAARAFGVPIVQAAVVGAGLALSSTALAIQILSERSELSLPHGRAAFAILLFHDIAVIPMLALVPLLGPSTAGGAGRPAWQAGLLATGVIAGVVVAGRYLLNPALRFVMSTRSSEVSTAAALLVVVGNALLLERAGLSMALGAFLAGVLLAESPYRHELEANIQPFKGLLLGLFFIAVGMSAKLSVLRERPGTVMALVAGLIAVKAIVLFGMGRRIRLSRWSSANLAITLAHGGVFSFVLFGEALRVGVIAAELHDLLIVIVAISMAGTPIMFALRGPLAKLFETNTDELAYDEMKFGFAPVVIAGFGRFGQMVGRTLSMKRIPFTAIEADANHVDFVRQFGNRIHYGDATRIELLRAAHVARAKVFVLAVEDVEASVATARLLRDHFPHVTVIARARNRPHAFQLRAVGIENIHRETFPASLEAASDALVEVGLPITEALRAVRKFRQHDEALLDQQYDVHEDREAMIATAKQATAELETLFHHDSIERAGVGLSSIAGE